MCTYYLCIFNKCFHHIFLTILQPISFFRHKEHVEMNKFHVVSHVHGCQ